MNLRKTSLWALKLKWDYALKMKLHALILRNAKVIVIYRKIIYIAVESSQKFFFDNF
jgi:hypothetical protein